MEAKKRETEKMFEVEGRKFKIVKFDAMTGSYVAFKLFTKALPMGLGSIMSDVEVPLDASKVEMSRKEFKELQIDCLNVCYEVVDSNVIPVMNENGGFRSIGLEKDTKVVMALTIHALTFNVKDFFGESVFNLILGKLSQ